MIAVTDKLLELPQLFDFARFPFTAIHFPKPCCPKQSKREELNVWTNVLAPLAELCQADETQTVELD